MLLEPPLPQLQQPEGRDHGGVAERVVRRAARSGRQRHLGHEWARWPPRSAINPACDRTQEPLVSLRAAVILLLAVHVAVSAAVLTLLSGSPWPAAVLSADLHRGVAERPPLRRLLRIPPQARRAESSSTTATRGSWMSLDWRITVTTVGGVAATLIGVVTGTVLSSRSNRMRWARDQQIAEQQPVQIAAALGQLTAGKRADGGIELCRHTSRVPSLGALQAVFLASLARLSVHLSSSRLLIPLRATLPSCRTCLGDRVRVGTDSPAVSEIAATARAWPVSRQDGQEPRRAGPRVTVRAIPVESVPAGGTGGEGRPQSVCSSSTPRGGLRVSAPARRMRTIGGLTRLRRDREFRGPGACGGQLIRHGHTLGGVGVVPIVIDTEDPRTRGVPAVGF